MAAFLAHISLVTAVSYPILEHRARWSFEAVVLMVATLSSVQVDNALTELKNVNGKNMHIVFQIILKVNDLLVVRYINCW